MILLPEFKRALALNQSLKQVRNELTANATKDYQQRKTAIDTSYKNAVFLTEALKEDASTLPGQLAKAYLTQFRNQFREEYRQNQAILRALQAEVKKLDGDKPDKPDKPDEADEATETDEDALTADLTITDP